MSDLLVLGRTTIEEARSLLYWLETVEGYKKLGICGLSMGGVHAAMVGSLHRSPVAILPFLTPHSAAVAFCEGILRYGTAWEVLMRDELLNGSMTREQVFERMRTVLALTDVTQFPAPELPKSVIFVAATVLRLFILLDLVSSFSCALAASYPRFFIFFLLLIIP